MRQERGREGQRRKPGRETRKQKERKRERERETKPKREKEQRKSKTGGVQGAKRDEG